MISGVYAAIVRRRREFYAARPDLRRRLRHPVISVGNIAVGGRGKTPTVAFLGKLLLGMGERPAVLSRGYARARPEAGVVVVRDPDGMRADLDRAGDEPLMLARQLPGTAVLASSDRYLAGCLAERQLGATVHLLDDGFQHVQLDRDVDLVLVAGDDLHDSAATLPSGRLREPPDALVAADAVLAVDERVPAAGDEAPFVLFRLKKMLGDPTPRLEKADGRTNGGPALALAGIARPEAFFEDLRSAGHALARTLAFRDHYAYSRRDVEHLVQQARASGARSVLTTEKDYVRLLPFRPFPIPIAAVPLTMEPHPLPDFRRWLADALRTARDIPTAP